MGFIGVGWPGGLECQFAQTGIGLAGFKPATLQLIPAAFAGGFYYYYLLFILLYLIL